MLSGLSDTTRPMSPKVHNQLARKQAIDPSHTRDVAALNLDVNLPQATIKLLP